MPGENTNVATEGDTQNVVGTQNAGGTTLVELMHGMSQQQKEEDKLPPPTPPEKAVIDNKAPEEENSPITTDTSFPTQLVEMTEGKIDSFDKFKAIWEAQDSLVKVDEYNTVKSDLDQLKAKYDKRFANPLVEKLNQLYADNASLETIKGFNTLNQLGDISELDSESAIVHMQMMKNGLSKEDAVFFVNDSYNTSIEEIQKNNPELEEDAASTISRRNKINRNLAATEAKEYLSKYKVSIENTDASLQRQAAADQSKAIQNEWASTAGSFLQQNFSTVKVNVPEVKEGVNFELNIPVNQEKMSAIAGSLPAYAAKNGLSFTNGEGQQSVLAHAASNYILENLQDIFSTIVRDSYNKGVAAGEETSDVPLKTIDGGPIDGGNSSTGDQSQLLTILQRGQQRRNR